MRTRRVLAFAAAVLAAAALLISAAPAGAATDPASQEWQFLELLNRARSDAGLAPLVRDPAIDPISREWSTHMRDTSTLYHRPDQVAQIESRVTRDWQRIGENVGYGYDVARLHQAFMDSPGHRANVLGDYNRVGIGVVHGPDGRIWVTFNFLKGPRIEGPTGYAATGVAPRGDFLLVDADGRVFAFGDAVSLGDAAGSGARIVDIAVTPTRRGYWMVTAEGRVFAFGDARHRGDVSHLPLNAPIVGIASTATGDGYWLVAGDGGIFAFGDAPFFGSTGGMRLNQPVVGMAPTPTGRGYWMVATDGGIFAFGDARFLGSTGGIRLNRPVNGMVPTATGRGYWLVADDGGIFAFGDARFYGSTGGWRLTAPIAHIGIARDGKGYWLAGTDGRIYAFGSAGDWVSDPVATGAPIVGIVAW